MLANHVKINSKTKGLITPKINANDDWQRCGNLCSMASQLRRNRKEHLDNKRLLARNENRKRSLTRRETEASLKHIQQISSSSSSSSDEERSTIQFDAKISTPNKKGKINGDIAEPENRGNEGGTSKGRGGTLRSV